LWRYHSTLTTETITELNFREPPHEFGSQLLEAGGELHEGQATLGHTTIGMTGRYLNATRRA
jgi:site-specific recombinase XerD